MQEPRLISIDGHTLAAFAYNEQLAGVPIVFIHGFTASIAFWERCQVPIIADAHPWYSLSLPGHYPAVFPRGFRDADLAPELFPRLLIPAIRELAGNRPVILAGHSTGGFAALLIAAHAPDMVRGVLSIAGFVNGAWGGNLGKMQAQAQRGKIGRSMARAQLGMVKLHPKLLKNSLQYFAADLDAVYGWSEIDASIADSFAFAKHLNTQAMARYLARMPGIDISDQLPKVVAPTLLLTGDRDPAYTRDESAYIHARLPNSELVVFPGMGHLLMTECMPDYVMAITEWLERVTA